MKLSKMTAMVCLLPLVLALGCEPDTRDIFCDPEPTADYCDGVTITITGVTGGTGGDGATGGTSTSTGGSAAGAGGNGGGATTGGDGGTTTTGPGPLTCDDGICQEVLATKCVDLDTLFCGSDGLCAGVDLPGKNDNDLCTVDVCTGNEWTHASVEVSDGDVCTVDTCAPDLGVKHAFIPGCTGACTNPTDDAALIAVDAETIGWNCTKQNLTDEAKAAACIESGAAVTGDCASCFAADGHCLTLFCLTDCIADLSTQKCIDCRAQNCDAAFDTCSGL